jgi:hypothetical protein
MDSSGFALHRDEVSEALARGEQKIAVLPGLQSRRPDVWSFDCPRRRCRRETIAGS